MALDIVPFQALVKDHSGLDFNGDNAHRLEAALQLRMQALVLEPGAYRERLRTDAQEFQVLVNTLTINETYFMRENAQLHWLVQSWVPRMLAARGEGARIRILSAGCSSGEEPYSIAMALLDARGQQALQQCVVVGVDIDTEVLQKAATGRYTAFSFRGVPDDVRARHFQQDGAAWVVGDAVRAMVHFQTFNVLSRSVPADLGEFDVVLFRNVSIYFDAPTRKTIQENLRSMMRADGILLTGVSETLANDLGVLHLREEDGLFYFSTAAPLAPVACKATRVAAPAVAAPPAVAPQARRTPPPAAGRTPAARRAADAPAPTLDSARALVQAKAFDPAHQQLAAFLQAQTDHVEAQLLMAYVLLNRKDYAQAAALAQRVLVDNPWSVDALYLLGHIHRWQQQSDAAIDAFKRALYACATCWPAHYYLGGLFRDKGSNELARRSLRAVQHLLDDGAPTGLQYVPVELPSKEMHHLCERQLANLVAPRV
jgi:chemotaxis protein methyltransferase CheR